MLEKAKNRKFFYFLCVILIISSLFVFSVTASETEFSVSNHYNIRKFTTFGTPWASLVALSPAYETVTFHGAYLQSYGTNKWRAIISSIIQYDTSSLDDGVSLNDGRLYVTLSAISGSEDIYLVCMNGYVHGVTDYEDACTQVFTGSIDGIINLGHDFTVGTQYNITIPSEWINKTGTTSIGFTTENIYQNYNLSCGSSTAWCLPDPNSAAEYTVKFSTGSKLYTSPIEYLADIDVSPSSGVSPLAVSFTDDSEGFTEGVDLAYLDYGDGNSYSGTYPGNGATRNYIYLDAGTYNYSYRLTHSGTNYYSNGTVTVTGDSTVNFQVIVRGLNGAYIGDATVNIWYDSGTMIDSDITDDFYGSADFYVNPSRYVNGNVTKDGYYTSNFTYYVCPTGYCNNEVWITLYTTNETPGSGDEFGNYLVTFKNANSGVPVPYSNIEVYSDSGYTTLYYDEYSNLDGVWTGLVPMNIDLYYKYPETTSYYSQTWSYNLTSSPSYKTVNLIPKSAATSTATPTPTITFITITPTVTYTYNDSNLSTLNVKERFTNLLVLAGFQNAESADLIFAMIIVLGCTALIGWITLSGSGAGMGTIIGFVFSLGLGLIPLWLLIAAIFLGCLYVALKLFGGSGE
jgi:hypothetical protein